MANSCYSLEEFLADTKTCLKKTIQYSDKLLDWDNNIILQKAAQHLCESNEAKMFRPFLIYQTAFSLGNERILAHRWNALVDMAACAELIHNASLLHDDVIDDAQQRRGKSTVKAFYGNEISILAGNFVLTKAFTLLKPYAREITDHAMDLIHTLTCAAIAELHLQGNSQTTIEQWRFVAMGKTGALFAWCMKSVCCLFEFDKKIPQAHQCGLDLGVVFQMVDDLIDLDEKLNKDRFSDIKNKQPSYPIILAIQESSEFLEYLDKTWRSPSIHPSAIFETGMQLLKTSAKVKTTQSLVTESDALKQRIDHLFQNESARVILNGILYSQK